MGDIAARHRDAQHAARSRPRIPRPPRDMALSAWRRAQDTSEVFVCSCNRSASSNVRLRPTALAGAGSALGGSESLAFLLGRYGDA
jgi:hypothetical protein